MTGPIRSITAGGSRRAPPASWRCSASRSRSRSAWRWQGACRAIAPGARLARRPPADGAAGLVAIAVHGITLLGDRFLDPGLAGIAVPFVIRHEPVWTGLGVTAGWLAALLGLSYWIRNLIGPALWRRLHRATIVVYVLSVAHVLGAGPTPPSPGCGCCCSRRARRCCSCS